MKERVGKQTQASSLSLSLSLSLRKRHGLPSSRLSASRKEKERRKRKSASFVVAPKKKPKKTLCADGGRDARSASARREARDMRIVGAYGPGHSALTRPCSSSDLREFGGDRFRTIRVFDGKGLARSSTKRRAPFLFRSREVGAPPPKPKKGRRLSHCQPKDWSMMSASVSVRHAAASRPVSLRGASESLCDALPTL